MIRPIFPALPRLVALAVCALASPAAAQDTDAARGFDVGAATDNRSKSTSKSDGQPSVWGEAVWGSGDGLFYAGPGVETIDASTGSKLEVQAFAGVRPEFAGFELDLQAAYKRQLDADPDADDDAWEFTANVSRSLGPAGARLQLQHSPDGTGDTKAWTWVEARLGWEFTDRLSGTAAVGRREQDQSIDYIGWNLGLTWDVGSGHEADLRWYDTNIDLNGEQYAGALVVAVNFAF